MKMLLILTSFIYCGSLSALDLPSRTRELPQVHSNVPGEIRVMVVDTGVGYNHKIDSFVQRSESDNEDSHGHGTHITGIILNGQFFNDTVCKNVKIFSCKFYFGENGGAKNEAATTKCFKKAIDLKIDVINYSAKGNSVNMEEYLTVKKFTDNNGILVTAVGNEHDTLRDHEYYPADYGLYSRSGRPKLDRVLPVQAMCGGNICDYSNRDPNAFTEPGEAIYSSLPDNKFGYAHGTSQAAALLTHKLIKFKCSNIK